MSASAASALVDYSDSDDSGNETIVTPAKQQNGTKRKLPPIGADLKILEPSCGPVKKSKIIPGEWLCHVFVEVPKMPALDSLIRRCHDAAEEAVPNAFHRIGSDAVTAATKVDPPQSDEDISDRPHISLTRPILVRAHEREMFVHEATSAIESASSSSSLSIAFARFDHLTNDDNTRDFLVLEIGSGWKELHELAQSLSQVLYRAFRAQGYYEEARFHASIGFAPMTSSDDSATIEPSDASEQSLSPPMEGQCAGIESRSPVLKSGAEPPLTGLVRRLEAAEGDTLRRCGAFRVGRVGVRVGKRVTWIPLGVRHDVS